MTGTREPYARLESPDGQEQGSATSVPRQETTESQQEQDKPRIKNKITLFKLGIAEVMIASISFLLTIINLIIASQYRTYQYSFRYTGTNVTHTYRRSYYHGLTEASAGIWCGAILLVSGILGIKAREHPSVCMYNANMTLSIVAATFMLPFLVISSIAAENNMSYYEPDHRIHSLVAFHSILAVIGFAAGIICIIHSAYCCASICCRTKPNQDAVLYYPQPPHGTQQAFQVVQLQNGQCVMVPQAPVVLPQFPMAPPTYQPQPTQGYTVAPQAGVTAPATSVAAMMLQTPQVGMVTPQVVMEPNVYTEVPPGTKQPASSSEQISVQWKEVQN